jgi:hypothetical protein
MLDAIAVDQILLFSHAILLFAVLRSELKERHEARMDRLTCLLRATELVQALGQPQGGSSTGFLNTYGLRPIMKLTPNAIKAPIFDAILRYSVGL